MAVTTQEKTGDFMGVEWKKKRVLDLLDALVTGQGDELKSYLSEDCLIIFPGFKTEGHRGVDELFGMIDQYFDGCPTKTYDQWIVNDRGAVAHGTLMGRFKDGRVMDGTRYTDTLLFDSNGKVTHWLVYNDLALLFPA
jgi:hypothetical protein